MCFGCNVKFEPGTHLRSQSWIYEGDLASGHFCKTCDDYISEYIKGSDEYGEGDILDARAEMNERTIKEEKQYSVGFPK